MKESRPTVFGGSMVVFIDIAANLALLTSTAARASDVVVQVLSAWNMLIDKIRDPRIELFSNTRHLQIHEAAAVKKLTIEWF